MGLFKFLSYSYIENQFVLSSWMMWIYYRYYDFFLNPISSEYLSFFSENISMIFKNYPIMFMSYLI